MILTLGQTGESVQGAGVTVITHGFNGDVTDWIIPMAQRIPAFSSFPGAAFSCYEISITQNGSGQYVATATFLGGTTPAASDSGEIIVKLDWSTISGGGTSSTTVANAAVNALLSSSLIGAMGGRPLVELPLHLIGHSRGGSVVTEMARLLGAQGVWVDQVTTLDPVPVAAFNDAAVTTYANVLFADNYWQTIGGFLVPTGQSVFGSYNRKLTSLSGGYSSAHSDVHLWYHGTVDLATPITVDGATIGTMQRSAWWTSAEAAGAAAGFLYSAIGGGDRLSSAEPAGVGNGRISDGFNKRWDLGGGGVTSNRTPLPANSGLWPNAIRAVRANLNPVPLGTSFDLTLYQQSGPNSLSNAELRILLDPDFNPYNGNETQIDLRSLPNTGTNSVAATLLAIAVNGGAVTPGNYAMCVRIADGGRIRYLYLRNRIEITSAPPPPGVDASTLTRLPGGAFRFNVIGTAGQTVGIMATTNLVDWVLLETHPLSGSVWEFTDNAAGTFSRRFYKAVLIP